MTTRRLRLKPPAGAGAMPAYLVSDRQQEDRDPTLIVMRVNRTVENPAGDRLFLKCPPESDLTRTRETMRAAAPHIQLPDPSSYHSLSPEDRQRALREEWRIIFEFYVQTVPHQFSVPSTSRPASSVAPRSNDSEYSPPNSDDSGYGGSSTFSEQSSSTSLSGPMRSMGLNSNGPDSNDSGFHSNGGSEVPSSNSVAPRPLNSRPADASLEQNRNIPQTGSIVVDYREDTSNLLYVKRFRLNTTDTPSEKAARKKLKKDEVYGDFRIMENSFSTKISTDDIFQCTVLSRDEFEKYQKLQERLTVAHLHYFESDIDEMKIMLLDPRNELVMTGPDEYTYFSANHFGSLHMTAQKGECKGEEWARKMFAKMVRFTAFCHTIGVVIRDLTLRKFVFVDAEKTRLQLSIFIDVIVMDSPNGSDELFEKFGCPAYMAPEIWQPDAVGYSGKAADVWSLGVVLFVLLTGRFPFFDRSARGLAHKIKRGKFEIPEAIKMSPIARATIFGLLMHFPCQRPSAELLKNLPWVSGFTTLSRLKPWKPEVLVPKNFFTEDSDEDIEELYDVDPPPVNAVQIF